MIYRFRILSNESELFIREIDADARNTFEDLHLAIQENTGFDSSQLASFFLADKKWGKTIEITLLDMGIEQGASLVMSKTLLKDHLNRKGQKIIYEYDFFQDRIFFIELTEIINDRNLMKPVCTFSNGEAPEQIMEDDFRIDSTPKKKKKEKLEEVGVETDGRMDFGDLEDYSQLYGEIEE
ncbi:MAG: hypothetical protein Q8859_09090 [Bacteroidota bacterium]|nr:hypothetical protein [Bacteroidota bacterium]